MKKIITIVMLSFAVFSFSAFADDELNNCEGSEVHGGLSVFGTGGSFAATVETCTNDDNTVRKITTSRKETYGVDTSVGGGSHWKTTKKSVKEYWCSSCGDWFEEQHNH